MEKWQVEHIIKNLPKLITLTIFNPIVKATLGSNGILNQYTDVDWLDAQEKQNGKSAACGLYYKMLMGRKGAYKVLYKALKEANQSGATSLLLRVPPELFSKPLTYLEISTEVNEIQNVEIEVNGKTFKLQEFFPQADYKKVQDIFRETIPEVEFYDLFITKEKKLVLTKNTTPEKPPYYVPRFLSNRIKIDEFIFKANFPDIFVFKNGIERYQLSQLARPHPTDTSTSQLTNITRRFIHLEDNDHWAELKKLTKAPIHLINYETDQKHFILEDSSAPSDILRKLGSHNERIYMPEEDFVQQQISQDCTSSSVCICDSPGMGKTFLLANIARLFIEKCAGRIVLFIQLTRFAQDYFPDNPNTIIPPETSLLNVLSYGNSLQKNPKLFLKLMKAELIQLEVFFDGLDEISAEKAEWSKQVFKLIQTNFPKVRIFITSRAHMRQELEQSLGVMAYDILPFNEQNQVEYLVQVWKNIKQDSDLLSLQSYASSCLKAINKSLTKKDKAIAGIPLLCLLIAEVCADKTTFRLIQSAKHFDVPLKISRMYQKFIEKKINIVSNNQEEFVNIKLAHIWHALKLLFPTHDFHEDSQFENISDLLISSTTLKAGILQKQSNAGIDFIHRTFAEYLVGEYFATKLQQIEMQQPEEMKSSLVSILIVLLNCRKQCLGISEFVHPVIVQFFNSALGDVSLSEELNIQFARIISFSKVEFIGILCLCCQHNLLDIFLFLGKAVTKCDKSWIPEYFTPKNCYELLRICIWGSTSQFFDACINFVTEGLKLDVPQINKFKRDNTLLQVAARYANYAAVEYFMDKVPLTNQSLLRECIDSVDDIENRGNILKFLLKKDSTLICETPNILFTPRLDVRLFKILVNFGANLNAANKHGLNCAMFAAEYRSPSDYHEIVQFLLNESKAEYLFLTHEKWRDPLSHITRSVTLLPDTLTLLLGIPGIDISIKDRWEESLLFSAVKADDLNELQQLAQRGVDYNARGRKNRSLLHVAAEFGGVDMVRYLLSLKLDPNSRDESQWTPLHFAALHSELPVVKVLVENGANVQAKTKCDQTALHWSAVSSESKSVEIIRYLIGKGAEVNDPDDEGDTPLHLCRSEQVRDCLVEMDAKIHVKNKWGRTPGPIF